MSVWDRRKKILYGNGSVDAVNRNNPTLARVWSQWHWVLWRWIQVIYLCGNFHFPWIGQHFLGMPWWHCALTVKDLYCQLSFLDFLTYIIDIPLSNFQVSTVDYRSLDSPLSIFDWSCNAHSQTSSVNYQSSTVDLVTFLDPMQKVQDSTEHILAVTIYWLYNTYMGHYLKHTAQTDEIKMYWF